MYAAVGVDCWVVVPIGSTSRKDIGHNLEGTRLTITCSRDQADAYEFSIRTPVTPTRWEDFDKELAAGFEAICASAIADGALLPTLDAHHCYLLLLLLHLLHALVGVAFSGLRSHQHGRSSTGCVTVSHQVRLVLNNGHVCCSSQEGVMCVDVCADKPAAADAILRYVYYWYNFMPLARGSAAVGYTTILSLFWAVGMPVSVSIPKDYQPDWEAILCQVCASCP
jgi:hypothetical protein